ncbi:MAG: alpha/beta hydrolase [Herminiimonas sp.]|nr:alpha/beta hydrolase [Herminiimonas sp.]
MNNSFRDRIKSATPRAVSGNGKTLLAVGATLALMAAFVQYRTRKAERDNPPVGRFIEVDGVRLHYTERGQGQPLVLVHGNGTMLQDFDISGVVDMASANYRVIVFDRPGFGYSERPRSHVWTPKAQAELLYKALQRLDIQNPIVVGHSWGTLVAIELGLYQPHYMRSLVLLSGYYYPSVRLDVALAAQPAIPLIGDLMRFTVSPLIGRMMWPLVLRKLFGPAEVPRRFARFPVWMSLRPSQLRASAAESALMIPAAFRLRHRYQELSMPVTIMCGENDRLISAEHNSVRLHEALPESDLRLAPGAGHMVHHLVPQQVMAAIDSANRAGDPDADTASARQQRAVSRHWIAGARKGS